MKKVSPNSIIFHRFNSKTKDLPLRKTMIQGKEVGYIQKFYQNFDPEYKSYIKVHISSVTLCDLFYFNSSLQYQFIDTKRNFWIAMNLQSLTIYSNDTSVLSLNLQLCHKPLGILQRVHKTKEVQILNKSVVKAFLIIQ